MVGGCLTNISSLSLIEFISTVWFFIVEVSLPLHESIIHLFICIRNTFSLRESVVSLYYRFTKVTSGPE